MRTRVTKMLPKIILNLMHIPNIFLLPSRPQVVKKVEAAARGARDSRPGPLAAGPLKALSLPEPRGRTTRRPGKGCLENWSWVAPNAPRPPGVRGGVRPANTGTRQPLFLREPAGLSKPRTHRPYVDRELRGGAKDTLSRIRRSCSFQAFHSVYRSHLTTRWWWWWWWWWCCCCCCCCCCC